MTIERFEDILAWQKARILTREIYHLTRKNPCARDFRFCSQIQSAGTSIMSNIAEGFERRAPKQFDHFLSIAKGSCAEVRSLLYVGLDAEYVDRPTFDKLMERANEIGRILSGFRKSLDPLKSVSQNSELGTQNSGANLG